MATGTGARTLDVRFVGSGSEYFRIWIVNLLLTLITVGLYYPFAKVRKLRYFHGATEVGGHPLSFHANPWKMLRGYLLVAALLVTYSVALQISKFAGGIALLIVGALWPTLWRASLRFRLANTGWRSLRFRFTGSLADAYKAMLPGVVLGVLFFGLSLALAPAPGEPPAPAAAVLVLFPVLMAIMLPALLWLLRRYQHDHFAIGQEASHFFTRMKSFYGVYALAALIVLGFAAVVGVGAAILAALRGSGDGAFARGVLGMVVLVGLGAMVYVLALSLVGAFVGARLQNLVWNGTRSRNIAFQSQLAVGALARLTITNWVLIICTLGLYFPFAA